MRIAHRFFSFALVATIIFSACNQSKKIAANPVPATNTATLVTSAPVLVAESKTSIVEGEKIFTTKCGRCHDLKAPANYTSNQWRPIMNDMAGKAKLTTDEKANVLAYVINNAKASK
jgi:cytochrome c5